MEQATTLSSKHVFAYGLFALPLAFVALPIYVHVPHLYSSRYGMSLAMLGLILLLARFGDAILDPLLGVFGDRLGQRKRALWWVCVPLFLGLWGLLLPPPGYVGVAWLVAMLVLVYAAYSLASVQHNAWGAELSPHTHERTRITAWREGLGLCGVVVASVLPSLFVAQAMETMVLAFALCLGVAAWALRGAPHTAVTREVSGDSWQALRKPLASQAFRRLLLVFAVNGIAAAIPASLVLFFIADVLQRPALGGYFLAAYFVSAALGLPLWVQAARRFGKLTTWLVAMLIALLVFVWAVFLGAGDVWQFVVICLLSGFALGADLALPPSLLADVIGRAKLGPGVAFGWWNFVAKLNLALAAGLALPLLALLGYQPGAVSPQAVQHLSWVYALLPASLKLLAVCCAWGLLRNIDAGVDDEF